jgi:G3E family GTPase
LIKYTVIGGYLGAGKTTLLNRMLSNNAGIRFALLINDFGEINIDAALIESETESQINLTNGCICCSLVDGFVEALDTLCEVESQPDHIVVEASGVADVANLAQFGRRPGLELDGVLVLADAETVIEKAGDKYVADTVKRQLMAADIILLNKIDLLSESLVEQRVSWLQEICPEASVIKTDHAEVPLSILLGVHSSYESLPEGPVNHEQYETWAFDSDSAQSEGALREFLEGLDETVIRAKGIAEQESGYPLAIQLAGRRRELERCDVEASGMKLVAIGLRDELNRTLLDDLAARCFHR